jgi:hypothetical protein
MGLLDTPSLPSVPSLGNFASDPVSAALSGINSSFASLIPSAGAVGITGTSGAEQSTDDPGMSRTNPLPFNAQSLLSSTARASDCFVYQRFSNKLQAFLIGYVGSTAMTPMSVYD